MEKIQQEKIPENFDKLGPLEEYAVVMENCRGQKENRMVIILFLALTEIVSCAHRDCFFESLQTIIPCPRAYKEYTQLHVYFSKENFSFF